MLYLRKIFLDFLIKTFLSFFLLFSTCQGFEFVESVDKKIALNKIYNNFYYVSVLDNGDKDYIDVTFVPDLRIWEKELTKKNYYIVDKFLDYKIFTKKEFLITLKNRYGEFRKEIIIPNKDNFTVWTKSPDDFKLKNNKNFKIIPQNLNVKIKLEKANSDYHRLILEPYYNSSYSHFIFENNKRIYFSNRNIKYDDLVKNKKDIKIQKKNKSKFNFFKPDKIFFIGLLYLFSIIIFILKSNFYTKIFINISFIIFAFYFDQFLLTIFLIINFVILYDFLKFILISLTVLLLSNYFYHVPVDLYFLTNNDKFDYLKSFQYFNISQFLFYLLLSIYFYLKIDNEKK